MHLTRIGMRSDNKVNKKHLQIFNDISRSITAEMNLIVVASLLFGAITSIESACPSAPGWMPGGPGFYDTCYLLSPNPMTYLQAQQVLKSDFTP